MCALRFASIPGVNSRPRRRRCVPFDPPRWSCKSNYLPPPSPSTSTPQRATRLPPQQQHDLRGAAARRQCNYQLHAADFRRLPTLIDTIAPFHVTVTVCPPGRLADGLSLSFQGWSPLSRVLRSLDCSTFCNLRFPYLKV